LIKPVKCAKLEYRNRKHNQWPLKQDRANHANVDQSDKAVAGLEPEKRENPASLKRFTTLTHDCVRSSQAIPAALND